MMVWKMIFLFQWCILRFHVDLPGCSYFIPGKCLFPNLGGKCRPLRGGTTNIPTSHTTHFFSHPGDMGSTWEVFKKNPTPRAIVQNVRYLPSQTKTKSNLSIPEIYSPNNKSIRSIPLLHWIDFSILLILSQKNMYTIFIHLPKKKEHLITTFPPENTEPSPPTSVVATVWPPRWQQWLGPPPWRNLGNHHHHICESIWVNLKVPLKGFSSKIMCCPCFFHLFFYITPAPKTGCISPSNDALADPHGIDPRNER